MALPRFFSKLLTINVLAVRLKTPCPTKRKMKKAKKSIAIFCAPAKIQHPIAINTVIHRIIFWGGYRSMRRPDGFRNKAASNVAAEYNPANMLREKPISSKIGATNCAIKNVCPGAEKNI